MITESEEESMTGKSRAAVADKYRIDKIRAKTQKILEDIIMHRAHIEIVIVQMKRDAAQLRDQEKKYSEILRSYDKAQSPDVSDLADDDPEERGDK